MESFKVITSEKNVWNIIAEALEGNVILDSAKNSKNVYTVAFKEADDTIRVATFSVTVGDGYALVMVSNPCAQTVVTNIPERMFGYLNENNTENFENVTKIIGLLSSADEVLETLKREGQELKVTDDYSKYVLTYQNGWFTVASKRANQGKADRISKATARILVASILDEENVMPYFGHLVNMKNAPHWMDCYTDYKSRMSA